MTAVDIDAPDERKETLASIAYDGLSIRNSAMIARDADAAGKLIKAHFGHTAGLVRQVLQARKH